MIKLPVIVGFGGINAAGRSSQFHSYKRMICDALSNNSMQNTWQDLAHKMQVAPQDVTYIKDHTLVRKIENITDFTIKHHHSAKLNGSFHIKKTKVSEQLLQSVTNTAISEDELKFTAQMPMEIFIQDNKASAVSSAGALPYQFEPASLYASHHHPRALSMTVYGSSDALASLGIEWSKILEHINPDEVSVYAGTALGQVDNNSLQGIMAQTLSGSRITSKMMALSLAEMPADFINSYIINSIGNTGHNMGACATFLYNLRAAMLDIQHGLAKVAIVGGVEAPITPEIIEGFRIMGALATDDSLKSLDKSTTANHRRACRPFSTNTGFTMAESAQFVVLMEDKLALDLGLNIYGSVAGVFVNADANKKSIAGPGVGNYVTMAKATALAKTILGEENLKYTHVQAHGTGTPQNRTTESHILSTIAQNFNIKSWPVTAVKSYLGHSIGAASGDQIVTALGSFAYGIIPGILTIDHIAEDVTTQNLNILQQHYDLGADNNLAVIINSKGFGGNNASAVVLSPKATLNILQQKYTKNTFSNYYTKLEKTLENIQAYDIEACQGRARIIYNFGNNVIPNQDLSFTPRSIKLEQFFNKISLPEENPYV
jgi:acetoacetyl-[acyl-carrier protein] synthase